MVRPASLLCLLLLGLPVAAGAADPRQNRLLVRYQGKVTDEKLATEHVKIARYVLSPLFRGPPTKPLEGVDERWYLAEPEGAGEGGGWDRAHAFARDAKESRHPAFAQGSSVYAEPDEEQEGIDLKRSQSDPPKGWPKGSRFAWHLMSKYSQLEDARKKSGKSCDVRLTILDTGIDPLHTAKPRNLQLQLGWNYVESNANVADPGLSGNIGHGTGTSTLLAGGRVHQPGFDDDIGGAPEFAVVPVRIANSVVHFWTSTMAQGIDRAATLPGDARATCDVVSISMGGVASVAWAAAVNRAYDKGVTIVAAAGNNFLDLPTRYTVYPSRFGRVLTVVGATAALTPYRTQFNPGASGMQGNYGPDGVMRKAIAAYTPEVDWAVLGSIDKFRPGAGTSAATPQVAAAAALWLSEHGGDFASWRRVEAVRWALFTTAAKASKPEYQEYFGHGLLRADDALAAVPDPASLRETGRARVIFPFLRILLGWEEPGGGEALMYEVEGYNLALRSPELARYTATDPEDASRLNSDKRRAIAETFLKQPGISSDLSKKISATMK